METIRDYVPEKYKSFFSISCHFLLKSSKAKKEYLFFYSRKILYFVIQNELFY